MQFITLFSQLLLLLHSANSFTPASTLSASRFVGSGSIPRKDSNTALFASTEEESAVAGSISGVSEASSSDAEVTKSHTAHVEPESSPYPIDLPSPLLLSASMVLAITSTGSCYFILRSILFTHTCIHIRLNLSSVFVGSLFELTGGAPTLGFGPQAALAAVGLPGSLFLIYAAVLKGAAETEEDDKQYNKPRSFRE